MKLDKETMDYVYSIIDKMINDINEDLPNGADYRIHALELLKFDLQEYQKEVIFSEDKIECEHSWTNVTKKLGPHLNTIFDFTVCVICGANTPTGTKEK